MLKKILGIIMLVGFLCGCDATVQIAAKDGGAPVGRATISALKSGSKNVEAQGATGTNGKIKIVLPYGDYKLQAEKSGYISAEGFVHVDLFSAMFGTRADIPLIKQAATATAISINEGY